MLPAAFQLIPGMLVRRSNYRLPRPLRSSSFRYHYHLHCIILLGSFFEADRFCLFDSTYSLSVLLLVTAMVRIDVTVRWCAGAVMLDSIGAIGEPRLEVAICGLDGHRGGRRRSE